MHLISSVCVCVRMCVCVRVRVCVCLCVYSGQDFWRWQIPEMVQKLEKSAIQANSTSERLALQLQAVELQISMVSAGLLSCINNTQQHSC